MAENSVNSYTPYEFSLTPNAIDHFSTNLEGNDYQGIRLSVAESSGCSGYTYEINFVEEYNSDDSGDYSGDHNDDFDIDEYDHSALRWSSA